MVTIDLNNSNTLCKCPVCNTDSFKLKTDSLEILTPTTLELNPLSTDAYCNECINGHKSVYINGTQYKIIE